MDDNQNSNKNNLASTNPLANPAPGSKLDDAFSTNSIPAPLSETPSDNLGQNITPTQSSSWPAPQTPLESVNPASPQSKPIPTFTTPGDINQQQFSENLAAVLQTPSPLEAQPAEPNSSTPPPEPAPTDLSQLTGTNHQPPPEIYTPPVSNNENLVVPTSPFMVPESVNTSHSFSSILKILFIGVLLLVLTGAASAYFIFGMRIPQFQTPSPQPSPINTTSPTPEPTQTSAPSPTNTLGGSNPQPTSTSSSKPKSAIETLKERRSSPSATR